MGSKIMASGKDCLDGEGEVKVESMDVDGKSRLEKLVEVPMYSPMEVRKGLSDVTWSDVTRDKVRSKVVELILEWSTVCLKRFSESLQIDDDDDDDDEISNYVDLHKYMLGGGWKGQDLQGLLWWIIIEAMTGRKFHLLEDKQIPIVGVFAEVFSTWMAFEGNTRDLGSFGEETDKTTTLHHLLRRITERRDGVTGFKRRRHDLSSDGVEDLMTASGRNRLKSNLEGSTW
ncbi:hypothetical protein Tco_1134863 [Tanacetum coccineum]